MKKLFIALFIVLAVIRIASHSLFHGGTALRPMSQHSVHQTHNETGIGRTPNVPGRDIDIA